jgi:Fuc2NAc and GlcNAc transferase
MDDLVIIVVFLASIALSAFLTGRVMRYAVRSSLLDIPNARSSHEVPTPRGGGLAIVIVIALATCMSVFIAGTQVSHAICLLFAIVAYGVLGWQDDKHDLSALSRFLVQVLVALSCTLYLIWSGIMLMPATIIEFILVFLAVLWITWLVNLYNFMDGIDGISGVETLVLGVVVSYWFASLAMPGLAVISIAAAGAALGFLRWNWSPAKIFMGDVGSLALGGFFAIIALIGHYSAGIPFSAFTVLYAVYLVDATITLLGRMMRKEKWWQAHRSHYYQRAVQSGLSHAQVSLGIMLINIVMALLATMIVWGLVPGFLAIAIAGAILAALMFLINSRFNRVKVN